MKKKSLLLLIAFVFSTIVVGCGGQSGSTDTGNPPPANPGTGSPPPAQPPSLTDTQKTLASTIVSDLLLKDAIDQGMAHFDAVSTCKEFNTVLSQFTNYKVLSQPASWCDDSNHFGAGVSLEPQTSEGVYRLDYQFSDGVFRVTASTSGLTRQGLTYIMDHIYMSTEDIDPTCEGTVKVNGIACQVSSDCKSCKF